MDNTEILIKKLDLFTQTIIHNLQYCDKMLHIQNKNKI